LVQPQYSYGGTLFQPQIFLQYSYRVLNQAPKELKDPFCDYERTDFPCVYFNLLKSFEPDWTINI